MSLNMNNSNTGYEGGNPTGVLKDIELYIYSSFVSNPCGFLLLLLTSLFLCIVLVSYFDFFRVAS